LSQTFENFLLLISDNASTDRTGEICKRFASTDSRIRYQRNSTNIGMAANYNLLFEMSDSKYFRWATTDDYAGVEMLADAVEVMEADPTLVLSYPRAFFIDSEGREIGRWEDDLHLLQDDPVDRFRTVVRRIGRVHHHMGLMRSGFLRKTGLFSKHVSSDVGLIAELSLHGKFFQIPKYQFYRRMHEDSSSWSTTDEAHQARRYHASNVRRVSFNAFRFHWRFVEAVSRSPLGATDKARAYSFLLRGAWWDRKELGKELVREARLLPRRPAEGEKGGPALANRNHS
jgi:glycosyltransferase involved in cell wall biosynthesis